jgi:hypothetical protein
MKRSTALLLTGFIAPGSLLAGEPASAKAAGIEIPASHSRWSFGTAFAPILNVDANFSGLGGFSSPFAVQPLGGGRNYNYDDGFVLVDSSGNAGGLTSFWGYDSASQYNPAGTGSINQNITNSLGNGKAGETEDLSAGMEFFAYLDMGKVAEISSRPVNWGFKGSLHYGRISIGNSGSLTSDVARVTDAFDLGGNVPPGAGYAGTFNGGGFLIGDDPSRTTTLIDGGATIQGKRDIDVDLFTLGFGPYLEIPVTEKFAVNAEAGANVAIAHGDYEFDSITTIAGVGSQSTRGEESRTMLLPGLYAGLSATYQLTAHFGLYASARYQYIDQFKISTNGSQVNLNFDGAAIISLGGVWTY